MSNTTVWFSVGLMIGFWVGGLAAIYSIEWGVKKQKKRLKNEMKSFDRKLTDAVRKKEKATLN